MSALKVTHVGLGGGVSMIIKALTKELPNSTSSVIWFGVAETHSATEPNEVIATWAGPFNLLGLTQAGLQLWRGLQRQAPDLVIAHGLLPTIFAPWLARLAGAKKVLVVEHGPQPTYTWAKALLLRLVYPWVDWTVSVSHDSQEWLKENFPFIPPHKNSVIENGVDLDRFSKVQPRTARKPFVIAMIARMDKPQKDGLSPILALVRIHESFPDIHLRFVGHGNMVAEMLAAIHHNNLASVVTIEPFRSDIETVLGEVNVALLSTHWEGQPLGVLEALAAGLPVIATDVVGVHGLLTDAKTGYLYPDQNIQALADVMIKVATSDQLPVIGQAGQELARRRFDHRRMIRQYVELIDQLFRQS